MLQQSLSLLYHLSLFCITCPVIPPVPAWDIDGCHDRLHTVLAQEPALRECRGEASGGALPFGGDPKVIQEAAAMKAALRHTFQVKVESVDSA